MSAEALRIATPQGIFDALAAGPASGRPVLLLHGFPQSARQWDAQLAALGAAGFRAVAVDQRGYSPGVRPDLASAYGPDSLIGDVMALADALGWEVFDLVGHDWGAAVAWNVAAAFPERLRTLSAISVPHGRAFARALREDPDQRARSGYFKLFGREGEAEAALRDGGLREFLAELPPERAEIHLRRMLDSAALTAALSWYRAMGLPSRTGPITTPVLYVWSTADRFIGETAARMTGSCVAGPYRFEVLQGVSHWIPEEAPEELNRLLLEHLRVG